MAINSTLTATDFTVTGNVALALNAVRDTEAYFLVSGTYGTVTFIFEASRDGGTVYVPIKATLMSDDTVASGTIAPADNASLGYKVACEGLSHVRLKVTAIASGTFSVQGHGGNFFANAPVSSVGVTGSVTLVRGAATATPLVSSIVDGTTGPAAVKAASTGAAATDKALVVRPMMPTNGTQTQPSGDAQARAVSVAPGDGTNAFVSGNAANLGALSGKNAQLAVRPGCWSVAHGPLVNVVATITKAAGAAGVIHVCTGVSFCLTQSATGGTPYTGIVNLRDGASGAGTVLGTWTIAVPTAACSNSNFSMSDLNIPGTAATAMCLEYVAAGGAQTLQSVHLTGYDAAA